MSYQVLARKYRPRSFAQFIGQESTCRVLKNVLDLKRIHHAYLFTGTRGIGKTTLARLLAKCLNCQTEITANPCNQCTACQAIDTHCFADLIEVDAASRTKVEDTRDLLADVYYTPSQGRYKVYLIDEVHMLSSHSFNALLKTLEEPPAHVIFLLATTDPQRLPATVVSRCLQFHLKALSIKQINSCLETVLAQEGICYEPKALLPLARAAQGSLRDALSLLDQAIAYTNQNIIEKDIKTLLGSIREDEIALLLEALLIQDTAQLWSIMEKFTIEAADFMQVLDEFLSFLHNLAIAQMFPEKTVKQNKMSHTLTEKLSPEDIQLYYQIALLTKRDLALAPTPQSGFEMMLLRILAFQPIDTSHNPGEKPYIPQEPPLKEDALQTTIATNKTLDRSLHWPSILKQLSLTGITHTLAYQCVLQKHHNNHIVLLLDPKQAALQSPKQEIKLAQALSNYFGKLITLEINLGNADLLTPARLEEQGKNQRLEQATQTLQKDSGIQAIIKTFDAKLKPGSIQFTDKTKVPFHDPNR